MISVIATAYASLMIYAGGLTYVLLSAVIYALCTLLYYIAKREQNKKYSLVQNEYYLPPSCSRLWPVFMEL